MKMTNFRTDEKVLLIKHEVTINATSTDSDPLTYKDLMDDIDSKILAMLGTDGDTNYQARVRKINFYLSPAYNEGATNPAAPNTTEAWRVFDRKVYPVIKSNNVEGQVKSEGTIFHNFMPWRYDTTLGNEFLFGAEAVENAVVLDVDNTKQIGGRAVIYVEVMH